MSPFLQYILLLFVAWIPVDLGIQALHQKQAGKPFAALALIAIAVCANAFFIVFINVP
jgi:predicted tellurium resistance membrane protein TerC